MISVASEGFKWIIPVILLAILFALIDFIILSILLFSASGIIILFFRDPERRIGEGDVLSPADGKIRDIKINGERIKISIFMRVYDIHINRSPVNGKVKNIKYKKGSNIPAFKKESEKNEKNTIIISQEREEFKITQIAGFLARRIKCYLSEGECLKKGERFGSIAFSSRVDITLPSTFDIQDVIVEKNDKVKAGITEIASKPNKIENDK